jgi:hypothetical protein
MDAPMGMHHLPPAWYQPAGANAFKAMETEDDDVIMASFPKCGTTWFQQIIFCLLRMDDQGNFPDKYDEMIGGKHQVYPDGVPLSTPPHNLFFSRWCYGDLVKQRRPRLFPAHVRAANLPTSLERRGRLVMITRNPMDALVSYFFFLNPWALWPGSFPEGLDEMALDAFFDMYNQRSVVSPDLGGYGDYYTWHRDMLTRQDCIADRAFFTMYERLHEDFRGEVFRLARFLCVELPEAKFDALAKHVAFDAMADKKLITVRKGVVGDYKQYLSPNRWAWMDTFFLKSVGDVPAMLPLVRYMGSSNAHCDKSGCVSDSSKKRKRDLAVTDDLGQLQGEWALWGKENGIVGTICGKTLWWPDDTESKLSVRDGTVSFIMEGVEHTAFSVDRGVHWRGIQWSDGHVWVPFTETSSSIGAKLRPRLLPPVPINRMRGSIGRAPTTHVAARVIRRTGIRQGGA